MLTVGQLCRLYMVLALRHAARLPETWRVCVAGMAACIVQLLYVGEINVSL